MVVISHKRQNRLKAWKVTTVIIVGRNYIYEMNLLYILIITHIVGVLLAVKECETAMHFSDRIRLFIYLFYNTYVQKALKILEKALLEGMFVSLPFEE